MKANREIEFLHRADDMRHDSSYCSFTYQDDGTLRVYADNRTMYGSVSACGLSREEALDLAAWINKTFGEGNDAEG